MVLQVCIDVIVQRLGDATAAGMYKLLFSTLHEKASTVSLYALPVRIITIYMYFRSIVDYSSNRMGFLLVYVALVFFNIGVILLYHSLHGLNVFFFFFTIFLCISF